LIELDEYEREDEALVLTMKNIHKTYLLGVEVGLIDPCNLRVTLII